MMQNWCKANLFDYTSIEVRPINSPDLNPINYKVLSILEVKDCSKPQRSVDPLTKALQKVWLELNAPYLRATIAAFPKRFQAYIDANGDIFELQFVFGSW
ncbi:hypothetical protein ANCCAN_18728 [Ancylostoma caninum]|uniref:Uncharacterized protein n=1 Tax=Ancylostoma caninum TaxID=29170 RepID=A0A368FTC3_ANCCA|nr:hypothetical protein ANCCAN_18728 [Ancylostoma caninum]